MTFSAFLKQRLCIVPACGSHSPIQQEKQTNKTVRGGILGCVCSGSMTLPIASPLFHFFISKLFLRRLQERAQREFKASFRERSSAVWFARLKEAEDLAGSVPVPSVGEALKKPCQGHLQVVQRVGVFVLQTAKGKKESIIHLNTGFFFCYCNFFVSSTTSPKAPSILGLFLEPDTASTEGLMP